MIENLFEPLAQGRILAEEINRPSLSFWEDVWRRFRMNPVATWGLIILAILALFAIFGPMISSHPYFETNLSWKNHAPCKRYWFGTDDLGRDMFTRTCLG